MKLLTSWSFSFIIFLIVASPAIAQTPWWSIQSIDTMKYSRDASREILHDPKEFASVIDQQIAQIAQTGATHVAIGTPYDQEFLPVLRLWVAAARKHNLKIWFRGNWSGWEGWFGYSKITRQQHLAKTQQFLSQHPELFTDGDIFTPCPECENGGPGDPRRTGDITGFRTFLVDEYTMTKTEFQKMNKSVTSNLASMNGDVARLIMDPATTQALGGIVTLDHYVKDPQQLNNDIHDIAIKSQGKVVLGEIGVPIPDIHGDLTATEQAQWIEDTLSLLAKNKNLVGINYWVSHGGSTQLWSNLDSPHPAVDSLTRFYTPPVLQGVVLGSGLKGLANTDISTLHHYAISDANGSFTLPLLPDEVTTIRISKTGYQTRQLSAEPTTDTVTIILKPEISAFCQTFIFIQQECQSIYDLGRAIRANLIMEI